MKIVLTGILLCTGAFGQGTTVPELRPTTAVSLAKSQWTFTAEKGNNVMFNTPTGALAFSFPVVQNFVPGNDTATVNYLETTYNHSISGYSALLMDLELSVTGSVVFNYMTESDNTCVYPAHARFIIDTGGNGQYDRWWANPTGFLLDPSNAHSTQIMTVALKPYLRSSVFVQPGNAHSEAEAGFQNALQRVHYLGLTFGGGCFFGHGLSVSGGTAQLTIAAFDLVTAGRKIPFAPGDKPR